LDGRANSLGDAAALGVDDDLATVMPPDGNARGDCCKVDAHGGGGKADAYGGVVDLYTRMHSHTNMHSPNMININSL